MRKSGIKAVIAAILMMCAQGANAEYFGLLNGRSADLRDMADMSVDAGLMNGDLGIFSYDLIGGRFNYRLIPGLIGYIGLGKGEVEDADGTALGFGGYYQLQNLIPTVDSSVKVSYHKLDVSRRRFSSVDFTGLSVELLVSGKEPLSDNGVHWYASLGLHRLTLKSRGINSDSDTEPGFGGGILLPVGPGTVFAGLEHIDELIFGAGFRFDIN